VQQIMSAQRGIVNSDWNSFPWLPRTSGHTGFVGCADPVKEKVEDEDGPGRQQLSQRNETVCWVRGGHDGGEPGASRSQN
jgi:hypothetical protein